jgi:hypothetical protein
MLGVLSEFETILRRTADRGDRQGEGAGPNRHPLVREMKGWSSRDRKIWLFAASHLLEETLLPGALRFSDL